MIIWDGSQVKAFPNPDHPLRPLWEHSAKQDPARIVSHAPRVLNLLIICILEIFRNGGQLLLKTKKNNIQGLVKIVLEMNLTIFWNEFACKQV